MAWTEERVDILKKLWGEGYSASQIAARLGDVTRNAVIGKAHRLGLSGRQTTRPAAGRAAAPARAEAPKAEAPSAPQGGSRASSGGGQKASISAVSRGSVGAGSGAAALDSRAERQAEAAAEIELETAPLEVIDGARPGTVTLLDLKERMCKWPIGDPGDEDFRFCGSKSQVGQPYCAEHCTMAFQPTGRSRDRKATG